MRTKHNRGIMIQLILCIITLILILLYAGVFEKELYGDEFFSFGLANSDEGLFYYQERYYEKCGVGGWLSGEDLRSWMEVAPDKRFQYEYVWKNQSDDVHPPFYYFLLHTLCSFFVQNHSKALGMIINLVASGFLFLGLIKWFANLRESEGETDRERNAFLPVLFLLMMPAFFAVVQYIRMYVLLMAECIWVGFFLYRMLREKRFTNRQALCLFVLIVIGGLTHYYFYLYCFFTALFVGIMMLVRRYDKNIIIKYLSVWIGGVGCALLIFPSALRHMFLSYRGKEVRQNLSTDFSVFGEFARDICKWTVPLWLCLVIGIIVIIAGRHKRMGLDKNLAIISFGMIVATLVIMKTAIYSQSYYIAPFFALLALIISDLLYKSFIHRRGWLYVGVGVVLMVMGLSAWRSQWQPTRNRVAVQNDVREQIDAIGSIDCYFVQRDTEWHVLFDNWIGELSRCDEWTIGHEQEFPDGWFYKVAGDRITLENPLILLIRQEFWNEQDWIDKDSFRLLGTMNNYCFLQYIGVSD